MMHSPSVLLVLFLVIVSGWANVLKQPQECNGGFCLPKHLCPTGKYGDPDVEGNVLVSLNVDQENECGDFLKICCIGASESHITNLDEVVTRKAEPTPYGCGVRKTGGMVYKVESNLTYADYGEFPWTVAIFKAHCVENQPQLELVGGGSLIHPRMVLTAAHILKNSQKYVARLGEWDLRSTAEVYESLDINIVKHIKHPLYRDGCTPIFDIAVALLERKVDYTEHIRPICLPIERDVFDGQRCIATGWGQDVRTKEFPGIMKRVELPVVPKERCQMLYRVLDGDSSFVLHRTNICAGGVAGEDTCQKDGGSPLVCTRHDGSYVLAGIVSWGSECGIADAPGGYVKVVEFIYWIHNKMAEYGESNTFDLF